MLERVKTIEPGQRFEIRPGHGDPDQGEVGADNFRRLVQRLFEQLRLLRGRRRLSALSGRMVNMRCTQADGRPGEQHLPVVRQRPGLPCSRFRHAPADPQQFPIQQDVAVEQAYGQVVAGVDLRRRAFNNNILGFISGCERLAALHRIRKLGRFDGPFATQCVGGVLRCPESGGDPRRRRGVENMIRLTGVERDQGIPDMVQARLLFEFGRIRSGPAVSNVRWRNDDLHPPPKHVVPRLVPDRCVQPVRARRPREFDTASETTGDVVGLEIDLFRGRENHAALIAVVNLDIYDVISRGESLEVVDRARHTVVVEGDAMLLATPADQQRAERQLRRPGSDWSEPVAEVEDAPVRGEHEIRIVDPQIAQIGDPFAERRCDDQPGQRLRRRPVGACRVCLVRVWTHPRQALAHAAKVCRDTAAPAVVAGDVYWNTSFFSIHAAHQQLQLDFTQGVAMRPNPGPLGGFGQRQRLRRPQHDAAFRLDAVGLDRQRIAADRHELDARRGVALDPPGHAHQSGILVRIEWLHAVSLLRGRGQRRRHGRGEVRHCAVPDSQVGEGGDVVRLVPGHVEPRVDTDEGRLRHAPESCMRHQHVVHVQVRFALRLAPGQRHVMHVAGAPVRDVRTQACVADSEPQRAAHAAQIEIGTQGGRGFAIGRARVQQHRHGGDTEREMLPQFQPKCERPLVAEDIGRRNLEAPADGPR